MSDSQFPIIAPRGKLLLGTNAVARLLLQLAQGFSDELCAIGFQQGLKSVVA